MDGASGVMNGFGAARGSDLGAFSPEEQGGVLGAINQNKHKETRFLKMKPINLNLNTVLLW